MLFGLCVVLMCEFGLPCYLLLFVWWWLVLVVELVCFWVLAGGIWVCLYLMVFADFLLFYFGVSFAVTAIWWFD